ncbi:50S ribosomal protein L3 [Fibrobacterota bacterium]
MNGLPGIKLGMTHLFGEDGVVVPVTVLKAEPATVVAVRTQATNGYDAVQLGSGDCGEKHLSKPVAGYLRKAKISPKKRLVEFKNRENDIPEIGSTVDLSIFEGIEKVNVVGISKGKGFAGTIKRYGFTRGPESHGSHNIRAPGAIGACAYPARVFPGQKLPGQYGNKRHTARNLKVVKYDLEKHLLFVKGAVPGPINGTVIINKV